MHEAVCKGGGAREDVRAPTVGQAVRKVLRHRGHKGVTLPGVRQLLGHSLQCAHELAPPPGNQTHRQPT
jgi:hypothetical protein